MSSIKLRHAISEVLGEHRHRASPAVWPVIAAVLDTFDDELDTYAELILAPAAGAVGFMTRGEGAGFTRRVASTLQRVDMPPDARAHHQFLAELFEHKRAFFKVEWRFGPDGRVEPMAACYFRRRPALETVLDAFQAREIATGNGLHDQLRLLAYALEKRTVHFVSAAFRPRSTVHHKLYFSQYVAPHTRSAVASRIDRVLERAEVTPALRDLWRSVHGQAFDPGAETTLFVSVSLAGEARLPWIKIDYPDIAPAQAAAWAPADQREQVMADASRACAAVGLESLSFLGVRLLADQVHPALKYYADFPDRSMGA